MPPDSSVTQIIHEMAAGDRSAAQRLLPHVYEELRALATSFFRRQAPNQTLQPTAVVHEAFVKLVGAADQGWTGRKHFFDVAAMAMRQLLTDRARRAATEKRGGGVLRVTLSEAATPGELSPGLNLVALDAVLVKSVGFVPQAELCGGRYRVGQREGPRRLFRPPSRSYADASMIAGSPSTTNAASVSSRSFSTVMSGAISRRSIFTGPCSRLGWG